MVLHTFIPHTHLRKEEIHQYIHDPVWQQLRISLLGTTAQYKLEQLEAYYTQHTPQRSTHVQVQNYLNALKRAGINIQQ